MNFQALRPGQEEAIRSVLAGRDTLVVQPTGAGKSAIYQISGLMMSGSAVVVSPLIALQKDQVDSIRELNTAEVAVLNSTQRVSEFREALNKLESGQLEYLFLAPEQLRKRKTLDVLKGSAITLFVVDEAHCISEWGHDFRPDYLSLGNVIAELGHPVTLALTATASPEVRSEIVSRLGMRDPAILVGGFDRPNISLSVNHFASAVEKREAIVKRVSWAEKPGIVYASTRRTCEELATEFSDAGVKTRFYHAGLSAKARTQIQRDFMTDEAEVIIATIAFGMGIDKPNIRFVYHADITDSLDSYYQQIGRGGRDGENAEAVLFYRAEDMGIHRFQAGGGRVNRKRVEAVAQAIQSSADATVAQVAQLTALSQRQVVNVLRKMQDAGALHVEPEGTISIPPDSDLLTSIDQVLKRQDQRKKLLNLRLEQMQKYAEMTTCRREYLLNYFGDDYRRPCGNCDICQNPAIQAPVGGVRREVTE